MSLRYFLLQDLPYVPTVFPTAGIPLCLCSIAYRRVSRSCPFGLFQPILCNPLCGPGGVRPEGRTNQTNPNSKLTPLGLRGQPILVDLFPRPLMA